MAKAARFKAGWSGSPKQTEVKGADGYGGGEASRPSVPGPRIGPGVMARRVQMEVGRGPKQGGKMSGRGMKTYSEG